MAKLSELDLYAFLFPTERDGRWHFAPLHESLFRCLRIGIKPGTHLIADFLSVDAVGIDNGTACPIRQLEAGEGDLDEVRPTENDGDEMFCGFLLRARDRIHSHHLPAMTFVVLQDRICFSRQGLTVTSVRIEIEGHHIRPLVEVRLIPRRKLMLIVLRPTMEITNLSKGESRLIGSVEAGRSHQQNRGAKEVALYKE